MTEDGEWRVEEVAERLVAGPVPGQPYPTRDELIALGCAYLESLEARDRLYQENLSLMRLITGRLGPMPVDILVGSGATQ